MDQKKFKDIFMWGKIIDIDLSQWDKLFRLVVIAKEETDLAIDGVLPVYEIAFEKASRLKIDIFHLTEEVEGHYQWNATLKDITADKDGYVIEFSSIPELVTMEIVCKDVTITPIEKSDIDAVCPGWDKPRRAFARAGISEMAARMKAK